AGTRNSPPARNCVAPTSLACNKPNAFAQGSAATKQSTLHLSAAMDCFASLAMTWSSAVAIPYQFRTIVRQRRGDLRLLRLGGPLIRGRLAPGCGRLVRGLFAGHVVILLFCA